MKLVTFTHGGKTRVGAIVAEEVVDISGQGHDVPSDLLTFLEQGETAMHQAREVCASGRGRMALADVTLEAPIRRPPKILAVGLNYRDHIEETGRPMPEVPMIFNKQSTAVTGPGGAIYRPKDSVEFTGKVPKTDAYSNPRKLRSIRDEDVVVRGGTKPLPSPGNEFSGAVGIDKSDAGKGIPHGQMRVGTVADIRSRGGSVQSAPEISASGVMNERHVNIIEGASGAFGEIEPNPVPKEERIR